MNKLEIAALAKVPPRVFILNALMMIGVLAVAITTPTAETTVILSMLPPEWVAWIQKLGFAAIAAKPLFSMIGDWLDNGKLDKSFQLLFLLVGCLAFNSCAGFKMLPPTEDGCFPLQRTLDNGGQFAAGPCINGSGKIDRVYTAWKNRDGIQFAARYTIATGRYVIKYEASPGVWVNYDSAKGGIYLDFPAGVSLDGNAQGEQIIPAG